MTNLSDLKLAIRFSLREMRGGLSGFFIFLACIALGVGAIGGVNSVARAITAGMAGEGRALLGGDMRFELVQREASEDELAFLRGAGQLAVNAGMRSMARLDDGSDQTLVEAKAVDDAYPLYGEFVTEPPLSSNKPFSKKTIHSAPPRRRSCSSGLALKSAITFAWAICGSNCGPKSSPNPIWFPTASDSPRGSWFRSKDFGRRA